MSTALQSRPAYDVRKIREDFPILKSLIHGKPLVYLDNAATTQKPSPVIHSIAKYYEANNANIHRGVHFLSEFGTRLFETARTKTQRFLNAADAKEIVFTRGTTESI
ncbi:MAG TPA: aminotransferase class V-fold PLP-dependent enzyme, partial [Planctomycetota bacterium]|nr:aminotransferase class V-fold PLP-dependent enzyme [Planctomycetota bacterium]